ncbi:hypothetical protein Leryth_015890 [Lithospermum erythrorhizon]|nr:hypothetical protein Leryth_015890 [Lithospermum erythrorhizon]
MGDSASVDKILEFMRKNKFTNAEAALRNELSNRPELNGPLDKLSFEDMERENKTLEEKQGYKNRDGKETRENSRELIESSSRSSAEISKELIVKEIYGYGEMGSEGKWKGTVSVGGQNKVDESVGTSDKNLTFSMSDDSLIDMYTWKYDPSIGPYENDGGITGLNNSSVVQPSAQSRVNLTDISDDGALSAKLVVDDFTAERRSKWNGEASNTNLTPLHEKIQKTELKEVNSQTKLKGTLPVGEFTTDEMRSRRNGPINISSNLRKDCPIKTIFPFSEGAASISFENAIVDKRSEKEKTNFLDIKTSSKEQEDEIGRALYLKKMHGIQSDMSSLVFPFASENEKEELPRLPPVKLKSDDKPSRIHWEEKYERDGQTSKITNTDNTYLIGSYLDVPIGQEINTSGMKRSGGGSWLSVSQGIAEDTSGFAPIGDGFPTEYWDSDEYDDDDDIGYTRQPIEDETWFLAHEIDYPSDSGKAAGPGSVPDSQEIGQNKDDDDQSFVEEDSYFSGEQYIQSKSIDPIRPSDDPMGLSVSEIYRTNENDFIKEYDGQLMDDEELKLMRAEPGWQGFVTRTNELVLLEDETILNQCGRLRLEDISMDDDQQGSVRSIGVGMNSDVAEIGSEVRDSLVGGSSEGDNDYFNDHEVVIGSSKQSNHGSDKNYIEKPSKVKKKSTRSSSDMFISADDKEASTQVKNQTDGGFSFPPPRDGLLVHTRSSKSLWSDKSNVVNEESANGLESNDDMLASSQRKVSESSPFESSRNGDNAGATDSKNSSPSSLSNYDLAETEQLNKEQSSEIDSGRENDPAMTLEDEEAAAVQEQVKQIKAQEDEFETFELKIVHRKNRTGFEENKNFHVVLNSVIAGRYHVTEYLGSAAFSKAIQAHDLHTGMDVCVKIIKNNKDFFDQSLDEIKLLKFVNKHDPGDKYHILRLYDYFYYREHLLIVCELLKANLYEFHKFNRESGGEVYFTMPRLQSITIQCLEALQFLHGLGLIHCDLKPENILVKSYSRCEIKVIDLGSSCFETDNLCSYVQSRSYRAPEVILGLSYDKKIDIWSLGCILAELCTGNVLFQNDSPATLLARVLGIIGPIDQTMLAKGKETYKYFTKNHMLYERNQVFFL